MLHKTPKKSSFLSKLKTTAKVLIVLEFVGCGATYFVWNRFNNDRDFRYKAHTNYNWALEAFYSLGELADKEYKAREADIKIWKQEGKI